MGLIRLYDGLFFFLNFGKMFYITWLIQCYTEAQVIEKPAEVKKKPAEK
jgi:hypothetical protein